MYEVSCRDLGMADCDFDLLAYSLERLEFDLLVHARFAHPGQCPAVDADPESPERRALSARIVAAAREAPAESLVV
jgi:predicted small metal-binding protein